jgi:hypothetical protein
LSASHTAVTGAPPSEVMALVPRTLMWATEGKEILDAELRHAQRVSAALSTMLARLRTESPPIADALTRRLSQASESTVNRVLLSPNVGRRLLWEHGRAEQNAQFLDSCLRMEALAQGAPPGDTPIMPSTWSALGDSVLRAGGEVVRQAPVGGTLAVDLESPDVIALGSTPPTEAQTWTPLAGEEQRTALEALTAALGLVQSAGASLRALTGSCAKVVVMRKRQTDDFCSFSACDYIGRITLVNPQLVNELIIAEALVHESIHSYLYMDEPRSLWGLDPGVRAEPGVVTSPWSGRTLPVCAFLHACFVWYGLFFFWGRVMASPQVRTKDVRFRVAQAGSGFMKGPLLDRLGPERTGLLRDDIRAALVAAQRNVLAMVAN